MTKPGTATGVNVGRCKCGGYGILLGSPCHETLEMNSLRIHAREQSLTAADPSQHQELPFLVSTDPTLRSALSERLDEWYVARHSQDEKRKQETFDAILALVFNAGFGAGYVSRRENTNA
jgi:hypothetical protein